GLTPSFFTYKFEQLNAQYWIKPAGNVWNSFFQRKRPTMQVEAHKRQSGLPLGYHLPRHISAVLRLYCKTNLSRMIGLALGDHFCILTAMLICSWAYVNLSASFSVPLTIAGWLAIARSQRGLENLLHDGSHYNWTRKNKQINDWLTDLLVAWPIFIRVS